MPLDLNILAKGSAGNAGLENLQQSPPTSMPDACARFAQAYLEYASQAMALDTSPVFSAQPAALAAAFFKSADNAAFLDDLPSNLAAFWLTAVFTGPSGAGSVLVPPAGMGALAADLVRYRKDNEAGADRPLGDLVQMLDVFTRTIIVTITTISGPIPAPLI